MNNFAFMNRVFPMLDQISLWKSFYSAWLRFLAFGAGILTFFLFVHGMRRVMEFPFWGSIGLCMFNGGIVVTGYMLIHLLWHRANSIRTLQEENYPVLRITSHIARLTGEVFGVCSFGIGMSAGIAILFAGDQARHFTFGVGFFDLGKNPFIDGSLTMVVGMGYSVLAILAGRMFFEMMVIMIDVAQNIRKIRVSLNPKNGREHNDKNDRHAA